MRREYGVMDGWSSRRLQDLAIGTSGIRLCKVQLSNMRPVHCSSKQARRLDILLTLFEIHIMKSTEKTFLQRSCKDR